MKRKATKHLTPLDRYHAESRTAIARQCGEGKGAEGLRKAAAKLGLRADSTSRPRMIFRKPSP